MFKKIIDVAFIIIFHNPKLHSLCAHVKHTHTVPAAFSASNFIIIYSHWALMRPMWIRSIRKRRRKLLIKRYSVTFIAHLHTTSSSSLWICFFFRRLNNNHIILKCGDGDDDNNTHEIFSFFLFQLLKCVFKRFYKIFPSHSHELSWVKILGVVDCRWKVSAERIFNKW
jgi:hypothetical protein